MNQKQSSFIVLFLFLLAFSPWLALAAESDAEKIDKLKQAVGVYSGSIAFKKKEAIELALWFEDKGELLGERARLGGFLNIGTKLMGQQRACTWLALHKYYNGVSLQVSMLGSLKKGIKYS